MRIYVNVISMYVNSPYHLKSMNYEQRKNIISIGLFMINELQYNNKYKTRRIKDSSVKKESVGIFFR